MQESLHNKNGKFVKNMMTETACTLFLNNKIDLVPTILAVLSNKKNIVVTWSSDFEPLLPVADEPKHANVDYPGAQKVENNALQGDGLWQYTQFHFNITCT